MAKKAPVALEELVYKLNCLFPDCKITVQQMRQPNADLILDYINKFMTTVGVDCAAHIRKITLNREEYGDIVQAIAYSDLIKSLVLDVCQKLTKDLRPGTILNPSFKFAMNLFTTLVNYLVFYNSFKDSLISVQNKYENLSIKNEELKQQQQNILKCRQNLAIKRSMGEIRRTELDKEKQEMKRKLKELKEEKDALNSTYASLKYKLDILSKDMPTERKAKLDRQLNNTHSYINLKSEEEKLEKDINLIKEDIALSTKALKIKKSKEIDYKNQLESELFSETNDRLIDIYEKTEIQENEIKKLNQELNNPNPDDIKNTEIQSVETEIRVLDKNHASIKKNMKTLQDELSKKKQEHVKIDADLESKIEEINSKNSNLKFKLKSIINEQENLQEKVRILDEGCLINYRKILAQQNSTHATFSKVISDAKNQIIQ